MMSGDIATYVKDTGPRYESSYPTEIHVSVLTVTELIHVVQRFIRARELSWDAVSELVKKDY